MTRNLANATRAGIAVLWLCSFVALASEPCDAATASANGTLNATPDQAIGSLIAAYESRDGMALASLLTQDFSFEFSSSVDPILAARYGSSWNRVDETIAALNLFQGFVSDDGQYMAPAQSVDLQFTNTTPADDNAAGRDPAKHKVLYTQLQLIVQLMANPGEIEGLTYDIGA